MDAVTINKNLVAPSGAWLAQSVEHETLNLRVVGSSPTLGVSFSILGTIRSHFLDLRDKSVYRTVRVDFSMPFEQKIKTRKGKYFT